VLLIKPFTIYAKTCKIEVGARPKALILRLRSANSELTVDLQVSKFVEHLFIFDNFRQPTTGNFFCGTVGHWDSMLNRLFSVVEFGTLSHAGTVWDKNSES